MIKWKLPPKGGHMDKPTGIYFQTMTGKEIEERLKVNDVIIIPVGSTEAHGPNAPPGEDTFIVTRFAEAVAEVTGCTVAEPIWYGSHPYHHMGMPGTVIVDDDVFKAYLRSVMAGLWNAGFRKQILLNGHGQEYVIPSAIHQFVKRYQVPGIFVNVNWWHVTPNELKDKEHGGPFETPFIHAYEVETSVSLALFPELIKMEYAVDTTPQTLLPSITSKYLDKAANIYQKPIKWYEHVGLGPMEVYAYPPGCVGKATLASASKATKSVEGVLNFLTELVNEILKKYPPGTLPPWEQLTQRSREEIDALVRGPLKGGKHIYTVAYPP